MSKLSVNFFGRSGSGEGTMLEVMVGECAEFAFSIPILAPAVGFLLLKMMPLRTAQRRESGAVLTLQACQWPLEGARA